MIHDLGRYQLETGDDHIGAELSRGRPYEPWVLAVLRTIVRGGLFVDVGAHVGNHTINLASAGASVVAFEPEPDNFAMLQRNVDRNQLGGSVTAHKVACGARQGTGTVTIPDRGNSGSATVTAGDGPVQIATLDGFGLSPDAIKVDAEGSEPDVLAGAVETLARSRPAIVCEVHTGNLAPVLSPFGYRQIPGSLAHSPTYLYIAQTRHLRAVPVALAGAARFGARRLRKRRRFPR